MRHATLKTAAALAAILTILAAADRGAIAGPPEEVLPAAEVVLDAYVEATGGTAAYEKVTNRVTRARMEIAAQGVSFDIVIYAARPGSLYSIIESDAIGKIEKGTDGTVVWESSAMMGPQIKEGQEKIDFLREAILDKFARWRDVYDDATCVGVEAVEDRPAYKVVLTPPGSKPQSLYFDRESKLLVKVELIVENPVGTIPVETWLSDYKPVDGIMLPHSARFVIMDQERIMTTGSIEHNVELPADRFDLPAEIRALLGDESGEAENVG